MWVSASILGGNRKTKITASFGRYTESLPLDIAIRCNGQANKEVKPRDTLLVPGQNGQLIYELAYKLGDEWKTQEDNVIPVRETEQAQMLILKSDSPFFASPDGTTGGFLQIATLRRNPAQQAAAEAASKATR